MTDNQRLIRARRYMADVAEAEERLERAYYGIRPRGMYTSGASQSRSGGSNLFRQMYARDRATDKLRRMRRTLALYRRDARRIADRVGGAKGAFLRMRYAEGMDMGEIRRRLGVARGTLYRWKREVEGIYIK